jgi:hypothetical protein
MNVIDNDKLSATIATALADAQARGVALEDHQAALLHDLLHGALLEASTDLQADLKPVLEAQAQWLAESTRWRTVFERLILIAERFNLSPPETPK